MLHFRVGGLSSAASECSQPPCAIGPLHAVQDRGPWCGVNDGHDAYLWMAVVGYVEGCQLGRPHAQESLTTHPTVHRGRCLHSRAIGLGMRRLGKLAAVRIGDPNHRRLEPTALMVDHEPTALVPLHTADLPLRVSLLFEVDTPAECWAASCRAGRPVCSAHGDRMPSAGAAGTMDRGPGGLCAHHPLVESHADLGTLHGGCLGADHRSHCAAGMGAKVARLASVRHFDPRADWMHELLAVDWTADDRCTPGLQQSPHRTSAACPGGAAQLRLQLFQAPVKPYGRQPQVGSCHAEALLHGVSDPLALGRVHALCWAFCLGLLELHVGHMGYFHPFRHLPGLRHRRPIHCDILWLDLPETQGWKGGRQGGSEARRRTEEGRREQRSGAWPI